jgi:hypothetical protein
VEEVSCQFSFRSSQQHQYWILYANEEEDEDDDSDSDSSNIVTKQLHVVGNCSTCPLIIHHPNAPRLLAVDYHGNWFVHSIAAHPNNIYSGTLLVNNDPQRPPRNSYGVLVWRTATAMIQNQHSNDNDATSNHQNRPQRQRLLPEIPIQPKPFLSQNGGWNIYKPNAWECVLQTDVRNGMTRHGQGRSTSLYFHVWIQDSRLFIHAQYIVFLLSIPILQQDCPVVERQSSGHGHDADADADNVDKIATKEKAAQLFLCNLLWTLFVHDSPRWYVIRHYLSMAANELEHLQQLTQRQVQQRGLDTITNPVLPLPARVDDVDDARDDGSMGLTATHAANTYGSFHCIMFANISIKQCMSTIHIDHSYDHGIMC